MRGMLTCARPVLQCGFCPDQSPRKRQQCVPLQSMLLFRAALFERCCAVQAVCAHVSNDSGLTCSYSSGPLPGPCIAECPVPVGIVWGAEDPWEKVAWGRGLAEQGGVDDYTELPKVGHCPQDEAPQLVNPLIRTFVEKHAR